MITDVKIEMHHIYHYDGWELNIFGYDMTDRVTWHLEDGQWIKLDLWAEYTTPTLRIPGPAAKLVMEALKAGTKSVTTDVEWAAP